MPFSQEEEPELFNGLEISLSNDSWIQYRKNHNLSPDKAYQTMKVIMLSLIQAYEVKNKAKAS